jgi:hypothetical protein
VHHRQTVLLTLWKKNKLHQRKPTVGKTHGRVRQRGSAEQKESKASTRNPQRQCSLAKCAKRNSRRIKDECRQDIKEECRQDATKVCTRELIGPGNAPGARKLRRRREKETERITIRSFPGGAFIQTSSLIAKRFVLLCTADIYGQVCV